LALVGSSRPEDAAKGVTGSNLWPLPCERSAAPTYTHAAPRVAPHQSRSTALLIRGRVVLRVVLRGTVSGRLLARRWGLPT
jgi:hypothetical protein